MGLKLLTSQGTNPSVIQQAAVLQMNTQELEDYLKELAQDNPMAELEELEASTGGQDNASLRKLEWLARMDEQNRSYYAQEYGDRQESSLYNIAAPAQIRLKDDLLFQLAGGGYTKRQMRIFFYIANSLDSRGYFTDLVEDAARTIGVEAGFFADCLDIMQRLQPAGVCARDLVECLLLQLERMMPADSYSLERAIVKEHLHALAENKLPAVARKLGAPLERVLRAKKVIQSLNPKPGVGYPGWDSTVYIVPDVIVSETDQELEVSINHRTIPALRVSREYMCMLHDDACEQNVRLYLLEKFHQVERAQSLISHRNAMLENLTRLIVERQREFFLGNGAHLNQLRMWEAAEELQVHESTISRTVKDKYLSCRWGIFPLDHFFTKIYFSGEKDSAMTTAEITAQIRALIGGENKKHPYSDQKLTDLLNAHGIQISRRTVAKYREGMEIPNCRRRRTY